MTPPADATSAEAFEAKYRNDPDPWNFAGSTYEQGRYAAALAALRRAHYQNAYEPGCSVGEFTAQLAQRCAHVVATDISATAVARATLRCKHLENVTVRLATNATEVPTGPFDLIAFSEIGYYFNIPMLVEFSRKLAGALEPGGEFVAVHWLGESADHKLHGDVVHGQLLATLPLTWIDGQRHPGFRIDSWIRP